MGLNTAYNISILLPADEQIPWLGAGIGIILGAIIVIADFAFTVSPTVL